MFAAVRRLAGPGVCLGLLLPFLAPTNPHAAPDDDARLTVRVVDPTGAVVPGAVVRLSTRAGTVREEISGADGEADFAGLQSARYTLHVAADGFRADPREVDLVAGADAREAVALRVSALTDTVVVSASHVEAPLSRLAASATVFTDTDLAARQIETVAELLRAVPGVVVASNGGRGTVTSVFPRGGESDFTLVLIDGLRQNAFGGAFDFGHLPVADVERVEVVRGAQSALFGSDAIGGVVHVVTRRGGAARWDALAEGGHFGTTRVAGSTAGSSGRISWGAAGERLDSDGYDGLAPATGELVSNDDYRRADVSATVGYGGPSHEARASVRYGRYERGYPCAFGRDPNGTFSGVDRVSRGDNERTALSAGWTRGWAGRTRLRAEGGWTRVDSRFTSAFGASSSATRRTTGRVQSDVAAGPAIGLSGGVEVLDEQGRSSFIAADGRDVLPIERSVVGTFGEARYERGPVYVVAGLRVERIHRNAVTGDSRTFVGRPPLPGQTVVSANPKVAASWFLRPPGERAPGWTRLRASAGTGIRPPDAFEIAFTDNPGLRPERSRSLDVGLEQAWLGGSVIAELTWFDNEYTDLIVAVGQSFRDASRYRTDNIANARSRGVELGVHLRSRGGVRVAGAYTWLDTAVLDVDGVAGQAPAPFVVGDWLIRRPRHVGSIDVSVTRARWSAFTRVAARGRALDVDPSFGAFGGKLFAPGYWTADAGAAVRFASGVEAFARVTNLFDRDHEPALGFPGLGRAAMVGIRVARGR
jgi:outer membrane cobalamin receptor